MFKVWMTPQAEPPSVYLNTDLDLDVTNIGPARVPSDGGRYAHHPAQLYHVIVRGGVVQEQRYIGALEADPHVLAYERPAYQK